MATRRANKASATSKPSTRRRRSSVVQAAGLAPSKPSASLERLKAEIAQGDLVPSEVRGTDQYLDIITWNIRYFSHTDAERVAVIRSIMSELNADIFVLQEIEAGAMDGICEELTAAGAGQYRVKYGTTGSDQRVAIVYDRDWVKAVSDVSELFLDENEKTGPGTYVFPRLPLHGVFYAYREEDPFTFHLVGVHLKSQLGADRGVAQRKKAASRLANWLTNDVENQDVIIAGDWNALPSAPEWKALKKLEAQGELLFEGWNDDSEGSYLLKASEYSRIDLVVVSDEAARNVVVEGDSPTKVVKWERILGDEGRGLFGHIKEKISDHLPVLSRYYFTRQQG